MTFDLAITGHGTYTMVTPLTPKAEWCLGTLLETLPEQWVGGSLIVESEFLPAILEALMPHCKVQGKGGSGFFPIKTHSVPPVNAVGAKEKEA